MYIKIVLIVLIVSDVNGRIVIQVNNKHRALDESLYEDVLDADQCHQQIRLIRNNSPLQIQCKFQLNLYNSERPRLCTQNLARIVHYPSLFRFRFAHLTLKL